MCDYDRSEREERSELEREYCITYHSREYVVDDIQDEKPEAFVQIQYKVYLQGDTRRISYAYVFWLDTPILSLDSFSLQCAHFLSFSRKENKNHKKQTMLLQRRIVVLVGFFATTVATTAAFNLKGKRILFHRKSWCGVLPSACALLAHYRVSCVI